MGKTSISWTNYSFNPWIGCSKVSSGCKHCYAETLNNRMGWVEWGKTYKRSSETNWNFVRTWNKKYPGAKVICASLADVFDMKVPPEWRDDLWSLVRQTPNLIWQILTKRPENIPDMLPDDWDGGWDNVWLGVSIEDWQNIGRGWLLSHIPAKARFISAEPLIGVLNLSWLLAIEKFHWAIVGGESGPGCRPMDLSWAREIQEDCKHHDIAFFMKQLGGHPNRREDISRFPEDLRIQEFPVVQSQ